MKRAIKNIDAAFDCLLLILFKSRLVLILMTLSLIITNLKAQEEEQRVPIPAASSEENNKEVPFNCIYVTEQMPQFIGGTKAMFKFLSEHIRYPSECIITTVYVGFIVEIDGSLSNIHVKRGAPLLNEEAMRVVKLMSGKWVCGYQGGKPAKINFTLPIKFRLE